MTSANSENMKMTSKLRAWMRSLFSGRKNECTCGTDTSSYECVDSVVLINDRVENENWDEFFSRNKRNLNPDCLKHKINLNDPYIQKLLVLSLADGGMTRGEREKIRQISMRREESKKQAGGQCGNPNEDMPYREKAEFIKDMIALSCVDGELDVAEKECIEKQCYETVKECIEEQCGEIAEECMKKQCGMLLDLAMRLLYLRLHFDHLLTVACADGKFQPTEKKFVSELLNSYIPAEWTKGKESAKEEDRKIYNHFYYKDLSFGRETELEKIALELIGIVRDDIDKDIKNLAESCNKGKLAAREWHDEHKNLHKAAVDNLTSKYILARRFVQEMLKLAYVDNDCSEHEIEIIKEISGEYGIDREEFENLLINVEVEYYSPVSRIHLGFYNKKRSWSAVGSKLLKALFGGNVRRIVMLALLMIAAIFVYAICVHKQVSLNWFLYYLNGSLSLMFRSHGGLASEIMGPGNTLRSGARPYLILQFIAAFSIIMLMFAYFGREVINDFARRFVLLLSDGIKVRQPSGNCGSGKKENWGVIDWIKRHDLFLIATTGFCGIVCFLLVCIHPCTWSDCHQIDCNLSKWYIALLGAIVLFLGFVAFLVLCRMKKGREIYVIWGYSQQGVALAADLMRMKERATVIFMLDRDTITNDEYKDATGNLWSYGCHWKKISFTDVGGKNSGLFGFGTFDSIGDCHFILSDNGRANRVLAQRIVDSINTDKDHRLKKRFYPERTSIYIRVKNSTASDLSDWLDDALIRKNVELKIFNDSEIISANFIKLVDMVYMSPKRLFENCCTKSGDTEAIRQVLFFGMGTNGRSFLKDLIVSGKLAGNAMVTVFESEEDNRYRCLYQVKSVLKQIGKIENWEECYNLATGKEDDWTWKLPYGDNTLTVRFMKGDDDVKKIHFKEWAWHHIYDEKNERFVYDLIVSCLGDDHVSMSIMRRISRIIERKKIKKDMGKHYFVQLDDIGYASLYGRYINKKMISIFGDYRSVFNSRIIWSDKICKLAEMFARCAKEDGVLIGANWNDGCPGWANIKYSSQVKYMRIVSELLTLLRIDGIGVEYSGEELRLSGMRDLSNAQSKASDYACLLESMYAYGNEGKNDAGRKMLKDIILDMYDKLLDKSRRFDESRIA